MITILVASWGVERALANLWGGEADWQLSSTLDTFTFYQSWWITRARNIFWECRLRSLATD